jgi:hemolysin III
MLFELIYNISVNGQYIYTMKHFNSRRHFFEELANSITHGAGFAASIVALVFLIIVASGTQDAGKIITGTVYGSSLILLYAASTLYHSFQSPKAKHYLKIFDHAAIYILIAGSYTPFTLYAIKGTWGILMLISIWTIAISGVVFKLFFVNRFKYFSTALYLSMGWLALLAIQPLFQNLPFGGLFLLIGGGVFYSVGVIFYLWEKLPFSHAIWHLFVMAGSASHFFAILFYVLPMRG